MNHRDAKLELIQKAKIAIRAIEREDEWVIADEYGVGQNQVKQWKEKLLSMLPQCFVGNTDESSRESDRERRLRRENEILKKEIEFMQVKDYLSTSEKLRMIDPENASVPLTRQCELLGVSKKHYLKKEREMAMLEETVEENITRMEERLPESLLKASRHKQRIKDRIRSKAESDKLMRYLGFEPARMKIRELTLN